MKLKYYSGVQVMSIIEKLPSKEYLEILNAFAKEPSADVVERKRGKWVLIGSRLESRPYACSKCNYAFQVDTVMDKTAWNFCPNCGAELEAADGEI